MPKSERVGLGERDFDLTTLFKQFAKKTRASFQPNLGLSNCPEHRYFRQ